MLGAVYLILLLSLMDFIYKKKETVVYIYFIGGIEYYYKKIPKFYK